MTTTKRILSYILFGLGFLTVTFFRRYSGTLIPYPFLFWLLGIILFVIGIYLYRTTSTIKEQKNEGIIKKYIADLKENGERIKVDLTKCEIKENNFTEEKEKYAGTNTLTYLDIERQIQMWNAIGDATRNTELVNINQSVIIFTHNNSRQGKTETFVSRIIPKDRTTLLFKLDTHKETTLYVDKQDRQKYYFELDFLDT
jgi:predicted membrane protein